MSEYLCPQCQAPNRVTARFCAECGAPLVIEGEKPSGISGLTQEESSALNPGMVLEGRYRIENQLGKGGFGAVYRAWDANLSRYCAIKENLGSSLDAQRQFTREARVLANLSHPNLPRVTDYFSIAEQGQYLVMDFVEGEDLASLVEHQGTLPVEQVLVWISQVADALEYLHGQNPPVLHRDIKPSNIRVTPQGKAMLVDFGLVKLYDPHLKTTIGARAVTPGYAPPEQYGQGKTDTRTDIYSLGATMYKLVTGHEPLESVQRVAGEPMRAAHQVNPQIPPWMGKFIECALALEPGQRYQSAAEFKTALRAGQMPKEPIPNATQARPEAIEPTMLVKPAPQAGFHQKVGGVPGQQISSIPGAPALGGERPARSTRKYMWFGIAAILILCLWGMSLLSSWMMNRLYSSADATATAELLSTMEARVQATATAYTKATSTAQAGATSTALARKKLVFGPQSGSLEHEADEYIESEYASVNLRDFIVEVKLFNPFSTDEGSWDYGIRFRLSEDDEAGHYRLIIFSDKTWTLRLKKGDAESEIISEGEIPGMDVSENGSNSIRLVCQGEEGQLYVNQVFITGLDLSAQMLPGDIAIGTGFFEGDEIDGKSTKYLEFTIWSIN